MIVGLGTDVLEIPRMARELAKEEGGFAGQVFTAAEREYCEGRRRPEEHFAARFAAKEALFKALGAGPADGVGWRDGEVRCGRSGAPRLVLRGGARRLALQRGVRRALVSLARTREVAAACVVLEA